MSAGDSAARDGQRQTVPTTVSNVSASAPPHTLSLSVPQAGLGTATRTWSRGVFPNLPLEQAAPLQGEALGGRRFKNASNWSSHCGEPTRLVSMRMQIRSLALLSGFRISGVAVSYGVGRRLDLAPGLL